MNNNTRPETGGDEIRYIGPGALSKEQIDIHIIRRYLDITPRKSITDKQERLLAIASLDRIAALLAAHGHGVKYENVAVQAVLTNLMSACETLFTDPEWKEYGRLSVGGEWSDDDKTMLLNAMLDASAVLSGLLNVASYGYGKATKYSSCEGCLYVNDASGGSCNTCSRSWIGIGEDHYTAHPQPAPGLRDAEAAYNHAKVFHTRLVAAQEALEAYPAVVTEIINGYGIIVNEDQVRPYLAEKLAQYIARAALAQSEREGE